MTVKLAQPRYLIEMLDAVTVRPTEVATLGGDRCND
jgi:hypothetical protein